MAFNFNGKVAKRVFFNGKEAKRVFFNGKLIHTSKYVHTIDGSHTNLNIDSIIRDRPESEIDIVINEYSTISSSNPKVAALTSTYFTTKKIRIINNGKILGAGGNGGKGGNYNQNGSNGEAGGTAIYTRTKIEIVNNGRIWGGGGGGGGGGGANGRVKYVAGYSVNGLCGAGGGGGTGGVGTAYGRWGGGGTGINNSMESASENGEEAGSTIGPPPRGGAGGKTALAKIPIRPSGFSFTELYGGRGGEAGVQGGVGGRGEDASFSIGFFGGYNLIQKFLGQGGNGGRAGYSVDGNNNIKWTKVGDVKGPKVN